MKYNDAIVVSLEEFKSRFDGISVNKINDYFLEIKIKGYTARNTVECEVCPFFLIKKEKFLVVPKKSSLYQFIDVKIGITQNNFKDAGSVKTIKLNDIFGDE